MRPIDWQDARGRWYRVLLPDGAPDEDASIGIPVGPTDVVDALGLAEEHATRLHNNLFRRGIFTVKEATSKPNELVAAVLATFKVDAQRIMEEFKRLERS